MVNEATKEIISIVQSVQHLDIADYGPTHAIFSDYNLAGHKRLYEASNETSRWLKVIHRETIDNGRDFRPVIAEIEQIMQTLDSLMTYSENDLDSASDELWNNGLPIIDKLTEDQSNG